MGLNSGFKGLNLNLHTRRCFIHRSVICLAASSWPAPKRPFYRVWSSSSFFKFKYLLFCSGSSNSCLPLLLHLPVPSIFPLIKVSRKQFLHKMRPIQLVLYRFSLCRAFLFFPWHYVILPHFPQDFSCLKWND